MSDVYSDRYWQSEFAVTEADLNRLDDYIADIGKAQELDILVKRIIRGRLRHGPETSPAALSVQAALADSPVRHWDPAGEWQIGDHVVIWTWSYARRVDEVKIGEVAEQDREYVYVLVEDSAWQRRKLTRAKPGSKEANMWRKKVEEAVARLRKTQNVDETIELVALKHGARIGSQLLDALRADGRFVRLAGRWFLRRLAVPPSEEGLAALAWTMLSLEEPQATEDLLSLLPPPVPDRDAGLFGLYLGMRAHPDLFTNVDPDQRPRWALAGPPPGPAVACYAAYDPDTHHVLCEVGETLEEETAQRLWELDLFRVVCTSSS